MYNKSPLGYTLETMINTLKHFYKERMVISGNYFERGALKVEIDNNPCTVRYLPNTKDIRKGIIKVVKQTGHGTIQEYFNCETGKLICYHEVFKPKPKLEKKSGNEQGEVPNLRNLMFRGVN